MLIEAGFIIDFNVPARRQFCLQLNIHPSRWADLRKPDFIETEPHLPISAYIDVFGNRVTRLEAPPGVVTFRNRFLVEDCGEPEPTPPDTDFTPMSRLPDDVLHFLLSSRYCDSDALADFAWSKFSGNRRRLRRVRAICDFVHNRIFASATRRALDAHRQRRHARTVGVCRRLCPSCDSLLPLHEFPARYCTGYLGDIGVPIDPNPMDFSAWFEVFIDGRWYAMDARHNHPRIGRVLMGRGRDAADVAMSTAFGVANLVKFEVTTQEWPRIEPALDEISGARSPRPAPPDRRHSRYWTSTPRRA